MSAANVPMLTSGLWTGEICSIRKLLTPMVIRFLLLLSWPLTDVVNAGPWPCRAHSKACDLLCQNGNFPDWVVTTAYYAAIFFADAKLFPLQMGHEPQFSSFNQYLIRRVSSGKSGKPHEIRLELVRQHLPSCYQQLRWLFDACDSARYNSYRVPSAMAVAARTRLEDIARNCAGKRWTFLHCNPSF